MRDGEIAVFTIRVRISYNILLYTFRNEKNLNQFTWYIIIVVVVRIEKLAISRVCVDQEYFNIGFFFLCRYFATHYVNSLGLSLSHLKKKLFTTNNYLRKFILCTEFDAILS